MPPFHPDRPVGPRSAGIDVRAAGIAFDVRCRGELARTEYPEGIERVRR
jgi:hypothetical protein